MRMLPCCHSRARVRGGGRLAMAVHHLKALDLVIENIWIKDEKPAKSRRTRPRLPDGLRTLREGAERLGCSVKTLQGHIASGALKYVVTGHGNKRPRKMLTDADLDDFIANQTRKDVPCPSYFHFDFQIRGHRFHGSTKCTTRREAEKIEAGERERAKRTVAQLAAAKTSLRLDDIADRYWLEVGQHHAAAVNTEHNLALLIEHFGKDRQLTEITGDGLARLVAWRRGHRRKAGTS
jgi:hypothetical protein